MNSEKTPETPEDNQAGEDELEGIVDDLLQSESELFTDTDSEEAGSSESESVDNVVPILPVHAAPNVGGKSKGSPLKVSRQVGRPRKVERMPTTSDLEYHAKMTEAKGRFIDKDTVVQAMGKHADSMEILGLIRAELAKESAALHFQRIENEKYGKDTAQVSTRRIDALRKIADIELEIKKIGGADIDVRSEKVTRIYKFFIDTVRGVLEDALTTEQIDVVFNLLSTQFEGWQEKLADVLR